MALTFQVYRLLPQFLFPLRPKPLLLTLVPFGESMHTPEAETEKDEETLIVSDISSPPEVTTTLTRSVS